MRRFVIGITILLGVAAVGFDSLTQDYTVQPDIGPFPCSLCPKDN